jgi:membrane dipeptidase
MIIVDSHLDLAWSALNWNRDLTKSVEEIRHAEAGMHEFHRGQNTVSFPEMRRGEVAVSLMTVLARCSELNEPLLDYRTRELASAMGEGHVEFYRIMEAAGQVRMLRDAAALDAHVVEWKRTGGKGTPLGFILAMEGADPILEPSQVDLWWERGLRVVEPVHYGHSFYGHGTGVVGGLTAKGRELVQAMHRKGMILDITHLSDDCFWECLDLFHGPVMASHHNCRALVPGDRQLSDEMIRALVARGAVIGVAFDSWMLLPNYVPQKTDNSLVSLDRVVDHIDHVCQLAGNTQHSGIGSDLDGGYGREQSPHDLNTIFDLQRIPDMLRKRGYKDADVENIMHQNWLNFFQKALPKTHAAAQTMAPGTPQARLMC